MFEQWTNRALPATNGQARSLNGVLDGEMYPKIDLERLDSKVVSSGDAHMKFNGIGLGFLARHLVTFDFPDRTMYLKRTSVGPLSVKARDWKAVGSSALRFLNTLKNKGQLPGWSQSERFAIRRAPYHTHSFGFAVLDFPRKDDSSILHYQVTRMCEGSPWKLQRAWRTDQNDHMIEEYTVP